MKQDPVNLAWRRFSDAKEHSSGKLVVCGHTIQRKGKPNDKGHTVCIDTAACRGGWLTCFNPKTGRYWQANEQGQLRKRRLKAWKKKRAMKKMDSSTSSSLPES